MVALQIVPPPLPTPGPPPAPLKEIGHVVARPICTIVREQARAAIAGLLLNDQLTAYAQPLIARYYNDAYVLSSPAFGSPSAQFDIIRLRETAYRMAHNLETVDAVLATVPTPAPSASPGNDARAVEQLRKQLNEVQRAQRDAINVVSGLAETEAMAEFQGRDNGLNGADGPGFPSRKPLPQGYAGLPLSPADASDPRALQEGISVGSNAISPYVQALKLARSTISAREAVAAESILRLASSCGMVQPSPSPSASP
jgi:hypothetical protein